MEERLRVIEMFRSIQGETTRAGLPCAFVRLAGCNLRCSYCDTRYAAEGQGRPTTVAEATRALHGLGTRLVCITGGEPLLQPSASALARGLIELGHTVLVETNGTMDTGVLPAGAVRIMDVKCPGSGHCGTTLAGNVAALRPRDEVKFVLCDRRDFDWAVQFVREQRLIGRCQVLFAPAADALSGRVLADWILESGLEARLQLQIHRILWPEKTRGA